MTRTLNFRFTPSNIDLYLDLMKQVGEIFNLHTEWGYEVKSFSKYQAHKALYYRMRDLYPDVPSSIIQEVRDIACRTLKRSKFQTKRPVAKQKYFCVPYNACTTTRRSVNCFTISTLDKRQKIWIETPHSKKLRQIFTDWTYKTCQVTYDEKTKEFWIHLSFYKDAPEKLPVKKVLGVDLGLHNIVTTSNPTLKYGGSKLRAKRRNMFYLRRKLQAKGTRSARKKLKKLGGTEMRFSRSINHKISHDLVHSGYDTIVMENLKGIRKSKHFSKKLNKWIASWSFYQLQQFITYKAEELGINVIKVNPAYTSQICSHCGSMYKESRHKSHFFCKKCGFKAHADINASINIRNRFLSAITQEDRSAEQAANNQPYMSTRNS